MSNLVESFECDLRSNAWKTNLLGVASTLYFQEDGILIAIPEGLQDVQTFMWSLSTDVCRTLLSICDHQFSRSYIIAPTCSGISATANGKSASMIPEITECLSVQRLDFLRKQLTGVWNYQASKTKKGYPAQLNLSLADDGSFSIAAGPDQFHSIQQGMWQVSPDGQFLVLYSLIEGSYEAEAINLRSVDFEDMVIDAESLPRSLEPYKSKRPLFLSKIN
jgi:hypothetical protein